jgi:hypothetical protein
MMERGQRKSSQSAVSTVLQSTVSFTHSSKRTTRTHCAKCHVVVVIVWKGMRPDYMEASKQLKINETTSHISKFVQGYSLPSARHTVSNQVATCRIWSQAAGVSAMHALSWVQPSGWLWAWDCWELWMQPRRLDYERRNSCARLGVTLKDFAHKLVFGNNP